MSSNSSNDKNDRPGGEGLARSVSAVEEVSRKRPFKSLAQDVSNTYLRGNNNIMDRSGSYDGDQINESIPEGLESMVRRMVSTATQDMQTEVDTLRDENTELKTRYNELKTKHNELEIKVKDLTLKNEYTEWSYTAEDIPSSHWSDLGFDEEYAQQMRLLISKMHDYTHKLRRGESPKVIELAFEDNQLLHSDILLSHWKEFADALQQYQKYNHRKNYGIERFFLFNVVLQQDVLDILAPALQTLSIKGFGLGRNIGSDVLSFTADVIKHNPYIQQLGWSNQIETVDDMQCLCSSIKNKDFILIDLDSSFDGNNLQMMQTILGASSQLQQLFLNHNCIGSKSAQLIANFLASNPSVECLHLKDNHLNDTAAALLANALKSNTNLQQIDLEDNNGITAIGRKALLESVFNVSSLDTCVASNHKCCIVGLNPDISKINRYTHPSDNRAMKIFTMLSATDDDEFFNMNCLGDLSFKLIPNVLRMAQKFRGRTPELSEAYFEQTGQRSADWNQLNVNTVPITSMFELLRGWAVPSLS